MSVAQTAAKVTVPARQAILSLYHSLLRAGSHFHDYNYRHFTKRRVREHFEFHRCERDPQRIAELYCKGQRQLGVIQRQVTINNMFNKGDYVIEKSLALKPRKSSVQQFEEVMNQTDVETQGNKSSTTPLQPPNLVLPGQPKPECGC